MGHGARLLKCAELHTVTPFEVSITSNTFLMLSILVTCKLFEQ